MCLLPAFRHAQSLANSMRYHNLFLLESLNISNILRFPGHVRFFYTRNSTATVPQLDETAIRIEAFVLVGAYHLPANLNGGQYSPTRPIGAPWRNCRCSTFQKILLFMDSSARKARKPIRGLRNAPASAKIVAEMLNTTA